MQLSQKSPFRPETCRHKYVPFSSVGIQAPTRHTGNIRHSITVEVLHLPRYTIGLKKNSRYFFYPIRSKTKANRNSLAHVFPRFASALCNNFEFWLVHWIICVLWLARVITLVLVLQHSIKNCSKLKSLLNLPRISSCLQVCLPSQPLWVLF